MFTVKFKANGRNTWEIKSTHCLNMSNNEGKTNKKGKYTIGLNLRRMIE